MNRTHEQLIRNANHFFNERNIDAILLLMTQDVHWPNGWEGGFVEGHEGVRDYWTRQWKELDPHVEPTLFTEREDGRIETEVHQLVKDLSDNVLFDGMVKHIYTIENNLIKTMEIVK